MKMNRIFVGLALTSISVLTGCLKNNDVSLPDSGNQTVYFGTQFPIRTVELGEDLLIDNTLDNQHKVLINATTGGVRENNKDIVINFTVDTTLCSKLFFPPEKGGGKLVPLPSSYYQLSSNQISIPRGSFLGGVEMQLTDAFFQDPLALTNNYALPVVLNSSKGVDSILKGVPSVANPNRSIDANWVIKPRDFVIYAIKYVNPWNGNYLRRGADVGTGSLNQTVVRHKQYVENDEVNKLSAVSMTRVNFPVVLKDSSNNNVNCNLQLDFDASGNCTITSTTANATASGSGKFVSKGEKNSWGNKDRDALYLNYTVNITYKPATPANSPNRTMNVATKDTLVMRDRAVALETFNPVYKP